MGKKMKKKTPNSRKSHHRASAGSSKSAAGASCSKIVPGGEGERKTELCNHYSKTVDELNRILIRTRSSSADAVACEHCREEPVNRRGGKEKGKMHRKKGVGTKANEDKSDQNFLWVCLDCGRYFCGGVVSVSEPYGHARRHAKQEHHQWAVRADNPLISWCHACNSSVPVEIPEEVMNGANEPSMNDAGKSVRSIALEPLYFEELKGHKVRGLSNLGNTCFFNSIMQNLFTMNLLRDHLVSLERPFGALTVALRMLFIETSKQTDDWGVLNPKALFGYICAKAPQFRGYQQQDSHELLRYLLEGLQMEETSARKMEFPDSEEKVVTFVETFFGGQLSSTVSCMECGHTSVVHEPFLDLSLPVPLKKPPSKMSPPPPPKRAKQNLRDRNKSKRLQEKGVSQVSTANGNEITETTSRPSKQSESGIAILQQKHDNASDSQDLTWMDYLGAGESANCDDFVAHELEEASVMKPPDSKLIDETERNASLASEWHAPSSYTELSVSSDTGVERTCDNEMSYSCVQIPGVLPLTCKEKGQDFAAQEIDDRTVCSSNSENVDPIHSSVNEYCFSSKSEVTEEFDGFGDLFNEPEVTSDPKTGRNVVEDMGITLWNDNSESNQEEVDNSNTLISINSCLVLFTKPEILTGEQAWYCEHCASIMSHQNEELGDINMQTATISYQSVTVKSMVDEGEARSKSILTDIEENSSRPKALDYVKSSFYSENLVVQMEGYCDLYSKENDSQKFSHIGDSQNSGEISSNGTTFSNPVVSNDDEIVESELDKGISSPPLCIDRNTVGCSSNQVSTFNGINDRITIRDDGEAPQIASISSQFQTNIPLKSPSKDITQGVNQERKKDLKSGKVHPAKESKGEETKMVKRNATKRILINCAPPILTIHLKRFSQDSRGRLTKLRGHVSFQEMLDLRPYMDQRHMEDECCYTLVGVVDHSGSMVGGHYVAYVRGNRRGGRAPKWFYASDAHVREVSLIEVLQSEAYILFYEKI